MTTLRLELGSNPEPACVGRDVERAVLQRRMDELMSPNAQADRIMKNKGAFTPHEAATLKQAASAGLVKGLLQVEILDPYSHARRIEFYGDDDGATWQPYTNPLRIGRFATPSKVAIAAQNAPPARAWYEAG